MSEKKMLLEFNKKVSEAKTLIMMIKITNKQRMAVARLACEACIIVHGGRAPESRLGIGKFARLIGMNDNTLYEWTRVYRNTYSKLTPQQQDQYDKVPAQVIRNTYKAIAMTDSVDEVRSRFDGMMKDGVKHARFNKYISVLNTIIHNVSNHSRIAEVPDAMLLDMEEKCGVIMEYLAEQFKARELKKRPVVSRPKIDMSKFWHDEIGMR